MTAACHARAASYVVARDGGIETMSGAMDADMLAALRRENWTGVTAIRFASTGGYPQI